MIKFKSITIRNFLSVGNATQAVNLENADLTLVLGNNKDLGGDGSRNGTGKSTLINGISFALYGGSLSNIRIGNLVNKTNGKGMLVTLEFEDGKNVYRIERGRKPTIMRFLVNGIDANGDQHIHDEGQGDSRETQKAIDEIIGMNHLMFKHLVALNTYNEPFLNLRSSDQREIVENLLGITLLSQKAGILRDKIKITKDGIKEEEYRVKAAQTANEQISKSIADLERKRRIREVSRKTRMEYVQSQISNLESIDLEAELELHIALDEFSVLQRKRREYESNTNIIAASINSTRTTLERTENNLQQIMNNICHECGQTLHDNKSAMVEEKKTAIAELTAEIQAQETQYKELMSEFKLLPELGPMPEPHFDSAQQAYEQKSQLDVLKGELVNLELDDDPYQEQIDALRNEGIQEINWENINELTLLLEHQDFLFKLLTSKDSFIRKQIIEQNLQYLNGRLNHYLTKMGLPHDVVFLSDLSVEITELGRSLDFDNLSRGERNRLILGLSWAFRDVHETTNPPIDFLAIDELIDSGLDSNGVEAAIGVLKNMKRKQNRNIFVISHRDELISRSDNILMVIKENGFTTFENSTQ